MTISWDDGSGGGGGGEAESDKIATLMWSQFHAYCFSLSEDRKAISRYIRRSVLFSARTSVDLYSFFIDTILASRTYAI